MSSINTNILFCFDNYMSSATISASSEASETETPVENVLSVNRDLIWRSGSVEEVGVSDYFDIELLDAVENPVSIVALWDLNMSPQGTIRIQSWVDAVGGEVPGIDIESDAFAYFAGFGVGGFGQGGFGGGVPKTLTEAVNPVAIVLLGGYREEKYWRITLTDPDGLYLESSYIHLGDYWQPYYNVSKGFEREIDDRVSLMESVGGQEYGDDRDERLIMSGVLRNMDSRDSGYLWQKFLQFKKRDPFTVCARFTNNLEQLFTSKPMRFDSLKVVQDSNLTYNATLSLKEWL